MSFSEPILLLLLLLIPVTIVLLIAAWKDKIRRLELFGKLSLIQKLVPGETSERQKIKMILFVFALLFIVFSTAGPQFGTKMMTIHRKGIDVLIAIDTSLSMLAEDIAPNRITRAREELKRLISNLEGNRIGIIAFAGSSFVQCPLTLDGGSVRLFLDFLDVGVVPQQGTEIGTAIRLAVKTFSQKQRKHKALIILTDGEDHKSDPEKAAEEAKKQGVRIYTIGFGNPDGEVIPMREGTKNIVDYKKDRAGKTVISRLDDMLLKKIALATNGKYYYADKGNIDIEKLAKDINSMDKKELSKKFQSQFEERFYYFVFIGLLLLIIDIFIKETKKS